MNYRQLEEAINKWTLELEEQEKIFLQQATQVNAWDRLLIDNGEKVTRRSASATNKYSGNGTLLYLFEVHYLLVTHP